MLLVFNWLKKHYQQTLKYVSVGKHWFKLNILPLFSHIFKQFTRKRIMLLFWLGLSILLSSLIGLFLIDQWISFSTQKQLYDDIEALPAKKVGLLLGTNKYLKSGGINPYFSNRIHAAAALYLAGKIQFILASGDNHHSSYNEPEEMKAALVALGVPENVIVLDYAGFRTLDSVVRAHEVFGENDFIIISQTFHNQRALFIANARNIQAIAFNVIDTQQALKVQWREYFARAWAMLDIYILNTQPRFLGTPIKIG